MSRRYADRIAVALSTDAGPRTFHWHGRRYVVTAVLASWQERRSWWRDLHDGIPDPTTSTQIWRVEARSPGGARGLFDLGHGGAEWTLLRAHD